MRKNKSKSLRKLEISIRQDRETTETRTTGPPLSAHTKKNTNELYKKPLSLTDENKALVFLSGLEVQFKLLAISYDLLGYLFAI